MMICYRASTVTSCRVPYSNQTVTGKEKWSKWLLTADLHEPSTEPIQDDDLHTSEV